MFRHAVVGGALVALCLGGVSGVQAQEKTVMVGGAAMYPSKNIIQNAVNSKEHTTLPVERRHPRHRRGRHGQMTTTGDLGN